MASPDEFNIKFSIKTRTSFKGYYSKSQKWQCCVTILSNQDKDSLPFKPDSVRHFLDLFAVEHSKIERSACEQQNAWTAVRY